MNHTLFYILPFADLLQAYQGQVWQHCRSAPVDCQRHTLCSAGDLGIVHCADESIILHSLSQKTFDRLFNTSEVSVTTLLHITLYPGQFIFITDESVAYFLNSLLIIQSTKWLKITKNIHHKFPEMIQIQIPLFCVTNSAKSKERPFTFMEDKEFEKMEPVNHCLKNDLMKFSNFYWILS